MSNKAPLFSLEFDALRDIESLIREKLCSDAALLTEVSSYLLDLGGKRVRPMLTLLVGRALGLGENLSQSSAGRRLITIAAGIELIHMATLLHDDIIDRSPLRRNKDSAFKKYGIENTLLTGDFLLTRAFGLCATLDSFVIEATERACVALTEGEILETSLYHGPHTLESSLEIARKKTAALFSLACQTAAHIARAPEEAQRSLTAFGEKIGIAFQVLDDILDVTADQDLLGKRTGQDLRERKPSVVNVLWLKSEHPLANRLREQPKDSLQEEAWVAEALAVLRTSPVIEESRSLAVSLCDTALSLLDEAVFHLSQSSFTVDIEAVGQLKALAHYVLERVK